MARIVRAFPLLPNKREALATFIAELTSRKAETQQFYRAYGVTRGVLTCRVRRMETY